MEILELGGDDAYLLQAEKMQGKWWLELIERATGMTWIIYCDTKKHAQACFKGMTMPEALAWMQRLKVTPLQMYKAGAYNVKPERE